MVERYAVDNLDKFAIQRFPRTVIGDEIAHQLSRITINWGRLEQALYWSTKPIDKDDALNWAQSFFLRPRPDVQQKKARATLADVVEQSYPDLLRAWSEIIDDLEAVQLRRNLLSHGLWEPDQQEGVFKVHPLRYDAKTATFGPPTIVDHIYVGKVVEDVEQLIHRLATIAAEFMAHQQLKKWGER